METIFDTMGALSAKAQALKAIITNAIKFTGSEHRIYVKVQGSKVLGFLKVGEKNLFYRDYVKFNSHRSEQSSNSNLHVFSIFMFMNPVKEVELER